MNKTSLIAGISVLLIAVIAVGAFALPQFQDGQRQMFGDHSGMKGGMQGNQQGNQKGSMQGNNEIRTQNMALREQHRAEMQQNREAVQAALESGDYNAWSVAIANSPRGAQMQSQITEENFSTFVEMHNAMQSGDFETAKNLAAELGLERPAFGTSAQGRMGSNSQKGMGNHDPANCPFATE